MRRRVGLAVIAAVMSFTAVGAGRGGPSAVAAHTILGGSGGVVSVYRVGPLRMDVAGPAAVRHYAGVPTHITYQSLDGLPAAPSKARFMGYFYGPWKSARSHPTMYWLYRSGSRWLLEEFETSSPRWRTPSGTRVGMTYAEAARRERTAWMGGCAASGFWHHAPHWRYVYVAVIQPSTRARVVSLFASGPHPPLC